MKATSLLLVIASSTLVSCDCPFVECCPGDNLRVELLVHDSLGRSLLDPDTPGYFNRDSVELFSLIDGELKPQTTRDQYRHYPYKIDTFRVSGVVRCSLQPQWEPPSNFRDPYTTVIKWSDSDSDTVDFEVVQKCDFPRTKTVWYNGDMTHELLIDVAK